MFLTIIGLIVIIICITGFAAAHKKKKHRKSTYIFLTILSIIGLYMLGGITRKQRSQKPIFEQGTSNESYDKSSIK